MKTTLKPTAVASASEPLSEGAAPMRLAREASNAASKRMKDIIEQEVSSVVLNADEFGDILAINGECWLTRPGTRNYRLSKLK